MNSDEFLRFLYSYEENEIIDLINHLRYIF